MEKKGIAWDTLVWWILGAAVLVFGFILYRIVVLKDISISELIHSWGVR